MRKLCYRSYKLISACFRDTKYRLLQMSQYRWLKPVAKNYVYRSYKLISACFRDTEYRLLQMTQYQWFEPVWISMFTAPID